MMHKAGHADSIYDESMHDLLPPGASDLDTAGFVKMIKDAGIDPKVIGVEVISDQYMDKGIDYVADYTYKQIMSVLAKRPENFKRPSSSLDI